MQLPRMVVVALVYGLLLMGASNAYAAEDSTQSSDKVGLSLCWPNCAGEPLPEWRYWKMTIKDKEPCWDGGFMFARVYHYYLDSNHNSQYDTGEQTKQERSFFGC